MDLSDSDEEDNALQLELQQSKKDISDKEGELSEVREQLSSAKAKAEQVEHCVGNSETGA